MYIIYNIYLILKCILFLTNYPMLLNIYLVNKIMYYTLIIIKRAIIII